jgi:hypothetical protein
MVAGMTARVIDFRSYRAQRAAARREWVERHRAQFVWLAREAARRNGLGKGRR